MVPGKRCEPCFASKWSAISGLTVSVIALASPGERSASVATWVGAGYDSILVCIDCISLYLLLSVFSAVINHSVYWYESLANKRGYPTNIKDLSIANKQIQVYLIEDMTSYSNNSTMLNLMYDGRRTFQ